MGPTRQLQQPGLMMNEKSYLIAIDEFLQETYNDYSVYHERFIKIVHMVLKNDKDLISPEKPTIPLNKLKLKHILKIQKHVQFLVSKKGLENSEAIIILNYLNKFCIFLRKKGITNIYYKPPKIVTSSLSIKQDDVILQNFRSFLEIKRYAATTIQHYRTSIKYFLAHSNYDQSMNYSTEFWQTSIYQFESFLKREVALENIALCTAYGYLKAIRLFSQFLFSERQISFKYNIPEKMIQNGKRSNEYIGIQEVLKVTDKIFEFSENVLRDISILLIILETGCRPLEIANMNIEDIFIHEKLVVLKSKKSYQRTLSLTDITISFIKQYLQIRGNYLTQTNSQALFLSSSGSPIRSNNISFLFSYYNLKAFNEIRFTPKTLRHTFITNALNGNSNITQVKELVGHKHLISTHYYFYRNLNHMKKLFLDKKLF